MTMSVDYESRPARTNTQSSPTFRQTGFSVPATSTSSTHDVTATATSGHQPTSPRSKLSNSSLNAALNTGRTQSSSLALTGSQRSTSTDADAEMTDATEPLPIPGKTESALLSKVSQSPNDLPTPPDAVALASHKPSQSPSLSSSSVRLPPLHSSLMSPRFSTVQGSSISSGPTSVTSSHWSPGKSSDPHLYSISSGRTYSYNSFRPSFGTSFKMSAERGRATAFDDEDDDEDDSFGKPQGGLGLTSDGKASERGTVEPGTDMDADGDASGVFSFSSPCFGPKQLDNDSVPSPELDEQLPASRSSVPNSSVLSPSWATASLGKLTLGSPETRTPPSAPIRRASRPHNMFSHSYGQTNYASSSVPSSADAAVQAAMKQRRYSYNKTARPSLSSGPSSYTYSTSFGRDSAMARHPYARTSVSGSRPAIPRQSSRSRSRTRYGADDARAGSSAIDDDETDEEMRMDDDDDATEDEADYAYARYPVSYPGRNAYGRSVSRGAPVSGDRSRSGTPSSAGVQPSSASLGLTFQMSPSSNSVLGKGLPHDPSRSSISQNDRSGPVSLSRQYSSDRHPPGATLAPVHRHHPYATSPGGTTGPLSASMGHSYSPGSNAPLNRPMHRRGSSLGNGLNAPLNVSSGMLSTSPRYSNATSYAVRDRAPVPYGQDEQEGGSGYLSQSPFSSGSPFAHGQRMDGAGNYYVPAPGNGYSQSPRYSHGMRGSNAGVYAQSPPSHYDHARGYGGHDRSDTIASDTTEGPSTARSPSTRSNSNTGASGNVDETAQVAAIRDRLGGAASCSAFISKLWHLMINPDLYSKYIRWDEAGTSIILSSEPDIANEFASDVLPRLFKHGNNASFVRQLNLYGFQRIPSSRLLDPTEMKVAAARRAELASSTGTLNTAVQLYGAHSSFAHPRFKRGHEELLPTMKPRSSKKPKKATGAASGTGQSPPKREGVNAANTSMGGDETDEEDFALS